MFFDYTFGIDKYSDLSLLGQRRWATCVFSDGDKVIFYWKVIVQSSNLMQCQRISLELS